MKRWFASDNNAGVHPEVMRALSEANAGHCAAYGDAEADPFTTEAVGHFRRHFGESVSGGGRHVDYDYNLDGYIDVRDITTVARLYGLSCGSFLVEFSHEGADSGFFRVATVAYDDYDQSFRGSFR